MIRKLIRWLDNRLGTAPFIRSALNKAFPDHWSFMLGEIALYCLMILIGTGVFLTMFYDSSTDKVMYDGPYPSLHGTVVSKAYESILRLCFEVRGGLLIRQVHHWAAVVFLAAIAVHMCRVFFTGAFRKPREINWMVGVSLLILSILAGFTGYSLPDDLPSGIGLHIGYSILLSVPFIGSWAAFLLWGGAFPGDGFLGRLLSIHILLIPGLIVAALALHLAILWHQKHTQFRGPGRTETNVVGSALWPRYALKSLGLLFLVSATLVLLGGFFQINPVWQYGPFDPSVGTSPTQPDWYMGWLDGVLRLAPNWELHAGGHTIAEPFVPLVVLPAVIFAVIFAWPFIERAITRDCTAHNLLDHPRDAPARTAAGVAVLTFLILLQIGGGGDVVSTFLHVPLEGLNAVLRVLCVVLPVLTGFTAYRFMLDLSRRDVHAAADPRWVTLRRTQSGGFDEIGQPK
ncbi:MAG: cytochrome bc complex cytochrome b subunit [Candidatus Eremiobacteraeota bacterium]|nr:cytochrome bc complex cytochrome b subunit [Candidatus Eremiobacteraeota bacterium]